MPDEKSRPIIIKKKVAGHGGHHGGAWKVAYADFVTAMMALFIVLWLMNSNAKVKEAVAGYFRDPAGKGNQAGMEKLISGKVIQVSKDDMAKLKEELEKSIKAMPHFEDIKNQIAITLTPEGLRIELMETEKGTFFESGSPKPTEQGLGLLKRLAEELGKLPNRLLIEGHTDARVYASATYSNWELSCDRANQARQFMQAGGLRQGQVFQVRGFADQQLRNPAKPEDASNRRISLLVYYQDTPGVDAPDKAQEPRKGEEKPAAEPAKDAPKATPKPAAKASP